MVQVPAASLSSPLIRLQPEGSQRTGEAREADSVKNDDSVVLKVSVGDELFRLRIGWPISVADVRARVLSETGASPADGRPLQLWRRIDDGGFEELPWNILSHPPSRPLHLFLDAAKPALADAPLAEAADTTQTHTASLASAPLTEAAHNAQTDDTAPSADAAFAEVAPEQVLRAPSSEPATSNGAEPAPERPPAATALQEPAATFLAGAPAGASGETRAAEPPAAGSRAGSPSALWPPVGGKPSAIVGTATRWFKDMFTAGEDAELRSACAASEALKRALEASKAEARERLGRVLKLYQARLKSVEADGNCQYRALSAQLYGEEVHHAALRERVVRQLREQHERYAPYVHCPFEEYLERMGREGEWGDNVSLQAASDMLGCEIRVLTDMPGSECVELHPAEPALGARQRGLCLAFVTEVHYDAVEFDYVD